MPLHGRGERLDRVHSSGEASSWSVALGLILKLATRTLILTPFERLLLIVTVFPFLFALFFIVVLPRVSTRHDRVFAGSDACVSSVTSRRIDNTFAAPRTSWHNLWTLVTDKLSVTQ